MLKAAHLASVVPSIFLLVIPSLAYEITNWSQFRNSLTYSTPEFGFAPFLEIVASIADDIIVPNRCAKSAESRETLQRNIGLLRSPDRQNVPALTEVAAHLLSGYDNAHSSATHLSQGQNTMTRRLLEETFGESSCKGGSCRSSSAPYTYSRAMRYYDGHSHVLQADRAKHRQLIPSIDVLHCYRKLEARHPLVENKSGLAIVVSISSDRSSNPEIANAADNMKQYAKSHGYAFYLLNAETSNLVHFFTARWLNLVTSQVWQQHEWVLHLDGDTIFLNFNKSFEAYTTGSQDIYLQIRLNAEVTAAAVLLRTSAFAECFVRLWGGKGLHGRANYDNGDLLSTLLDFAAPDIAGLCEDARVEDYDKFIECFSMIHARLLKLSDFMPISVFPPLSGFWKSLEGLQDDPFEHESPEHFKLLFRCWSSDIIGHGSKTIGTWAWASRVDKTGSAPNCLYNTPEEELEVAKRCCLWHFPGCMVGEENVCKKEEHCITSPGTMLHCPRESGAN